MQLVYQYLTGPRFRHRIEAIVEKFSELQEDLEKERKMMNRLWAKREVLIRGVLESTVGMYGDLQGSRKRRRTGLSSQGATAPPTSPINFRRLMPADPTEVRFGSMLSINIFRGASEQHCFKIGARRATLIQRTRPLDSIVARVLLVADFIDSIGQ